MARGGPYSTLLDPYSILFNAGSSLNSLHSLDLDVDACSCCEADLCNNSPEPASARLEMAYEVNDSRARALRHTLAGLLGALLLLGLLV